jgi:hypothetical protein
MHRPPTTADAMIVGRQLSDVGGSDSESSHTDVLCTTCMVECPSIPELKERHP